MQANLLVGIGATVGAVGIILLFMICCFFKSIRVAIAVLQVSSDCFRRLFGLIFLPLLFVPLICVHLIWSVVGAFTF